MLRPQRFCIFCRKAGLTHEHVWADWLKRFIPKTAVEYTYLAATLHPTQSDFKRKKIAGDLQSRRLRVVCKSCNNGWMGKLQERAKPRLLPLMQSEVTAFDAGVQETIAAWIAMFTMVAEHFDPRKVVSTQAEREYLRKNRKPPPNWQIWIADYERGDWPALLAHFAVPISSPHCAPEIMDNGLPRPNTQTMSFVVGRLYVHVRSSATDIFENWRFARPDVLAQIWPIRRNIVAWPLKTLTDRDADGIANSFHLASDSVARRMAEETGS
jgi:hypothetical protein